MELRTRSWTLVSGMIRALWTFPFHVIRCKLKHVVTLILFFSKRFRLRCTQPHVTLMSNYEGIMVQFNLHLFGVSFAYGVSKTVSFDTN